MQFLYPGVLWAMGLIIVPVIIHLFNFRRVKKVYFSNTAFLQQVKKATNKQSQLKRLLILFSRILFIIFLVLAFAQPISTDDEISPQTLMRVYLDNSLSMSQSGLGGMTLLDEGVKIVEDLVTANDPGLRYTFTTNNFNLGAGNYLQGKELKEKLTEVDFSRRSREIGDVIRRMNTGDPISGTSTFIISDFQKMSTASLSEILEDTLTQYFLVKLKNEGAGNLFVDTLYLESSIGLSSSNLLNLSIRNMRVEPVENVLVKVFKDSIQFSTFTVDIVGMSREHAKVDIGSYQEIAGDYMIEVEDPDLPFDNHYFFTIAAPGTTNVVIIADRPNKYLQAAFSNSDIFSLDSFTLSNIDYDAVNDAQFLILSGLSEIPDWITPDLLEKLSILVVPSDGINISSYEELLGLRIQHPADSFQLTVSNRNLNSPLFEGVFSSLSPQISLPWLIRPFRVQGFHHTILNTNLDLPFLIRAGNENVYFFTVPFEDKYTDFHKHSLFIPVLYKISQLNNGQQQRLAFSFNEQLVSIGNIKIPETAIPRVSNTNQSFVPGVVRSRDNVLLDIPDEIEEPGIYSLSIAEDTVIRLAFNHDQEESIIETYNMKELQSMAEGVDHVKIYDVIEAEAFSQSIREMNEGVGLWKYALLLALIFVIIEMLLLRFT